LYLSKKKYQETFLTGFVELNYTTPTNTLNDQQQTYVNVNILKQAIVSMNEEIEKLKGDVSNLQDQVKTLTNQQSDMVSNSTPDVSGTQL
jgi:TolA-binding protein